MEAAPPTVRCTAVALGYNLCMGLFGGLSPLVATWLVERTGDEIAPAFSSWRRPLVTFHRRSSGSMELTRSPSSLPPHAQSRHSSVSIQAAVAAQYENVRFRFQTISPVAGMSSGALPATLLEVRPVHSHRNEALPVFSPYPHPPTTAQLTVRGSQGSVVR